MYQQLNIKTMAKKKTIYKTVVSITVLSDEPLDGASLDDIAYQIEDGDWVGYNLIHKEKPIKGSAAIQAISDSGSDPAFFFMDQDGYPLEGYEDE